jgi:hypothetical protein
MIRIILILFILANIFIFSSEYYSIIPAIEYSDQNHLMSFLT